jgi:hypothetical protein
VFQVRITPLPDFSLLCDSPAQHSLNAGLPTRAIPSVNNDGWEKDTDARRWRRFIVDRRRGINPFTVSIRPIHTPATNIVVATASVIVTVVVIPTASVLVTALVMPSPTVMVIPGEGRRNFHTADNCG